MRDLFLSGVLLAFVFYGFRAPFALMLGYIWVDIFTPQLVAYGFLRSVPVSQVIGIAAIVAFLVNPPKQKVVHSSAIFVMFVFGLWMTLTLFWSVLPEAAYSKWSWAIKSIWVACLVPYFIRERVEVEALVWTILLSGIAHCIPFGLKVLISGGGYGYSLGLVSSNSGLAEGSTLAMFSVTLIPMCFYLKNNSMIFSSSRLVKFMLFGFVFLALLTSLGTFSRTGLVSAATLVFMLVLKSKRKVALSVAVALVAIALVGVMGVEWEARMRTTTDTSESSAMGRVAAWLWTMDFVSTHPLGGGFRAHYSSEYDLVLDNGNVLHIQRKAPHNIFFEVLGEGGIPGAVLYLFIVISAIYRYLKISRLQLEDGSRWIAQLSGSLLMSFTVFCVGGMFVGVAFQSYSYYLIVLSVILSSLAERVCSDNLRKAR